MSMFKSRVLLLTLLVAAVVAPAFATGPISTEISALSPFLKGTQNVDLLFTMTNVSDHSVRVLRWNTPLDGIEGDLFEVARNGELVPYLGREYKRGVPTAEDFMMLRAGESISTLIELSSSYEMQFGGEYVIRFRNVSFSHLPTKGVQASGLIDLSSNQEVIWIEGKEAPILDVRNPISTQKARPNRETCSNERKAILANALAAAQNIAADSYSYLSGSQNSNSTRYTEWFGAFSSSRWNTVEGNFQAISDALDNENVEFNCKCKKNYYAYVYPNEPYKIYLCKVFWQAALTGTDSQAGTLVHEMSHFNVVAGTDDVTYGQSSCRALANSNPNDAIQNADSHEYFAENTPSLP